MSSDMNVSWIDPNAYKTQPQTKQKIEADVKKAPETTNAAGRGATSAIIRSTKHKSIPGGDQRDHVTVDYKLSNGSHLTTRHVPTK